MSVSNTPQAGMQQIDLSKLNVHQLTQLKRQLDRELNVFQNSLQALKMAHGKYVESRDNVSKVSPEAEGKEILVPLTSSMYVPGTISDANNVVVDIGTGYYVQKNIKDAADYFKRKVDFVMEQIEKIQLLGLEKSKIREAIMYMIEIKVQPQVQKAAAS